MTGPNLNGTYLFGGFVDPAMRKAMQERRKLMPLSGALSPQKAQGAPMPGAGGNPGLQMRAASISGPRQSIFSRFGNGF